MVGWKRWFYSIIGWEYDPVADEHQKHLKYLVIEQIKNTKDIKKILKEQQEIKEDDFIENVNQEDIFIEVQGVYSNNHYLNAIPDFPDNNNNNNNKKKSRTKKHKRIKV